MKESIKNYLARTGFEALRLKAVLFDMDGVCYDSMPNHVIAWCQAMELNGIHMTEDDVYAYEGAHGIDTIKAIYRRETHEEIEDERAREIYALKSKIFHERLPEAPIMPGVLELMEQIKACGLTIGIVTGSGQIPLLERLKNDFKEFVTADRMVSALDKLKHGKPFPAPYLAGMHKTGCENPWEAMVVENAPLGVKSAVNARIFTIAVNSGPLPDEELAAKGANLIIKPMTELSRQWKDIFEAAASSGKSL